MDLHVGIHDFRSVICIVVNIRNSNRQNRPRLLGPTYTGHDALRIFHFLASTAISRGVRHLSFPLGNCRKGIHYSEQRKDGCYSSIIWLGKDKGIFE